MSKIRLHIKGQERLISGHKPRYLSVARGTVGGSASISSKSISHSHFIFLVRSLAESIAIGSIGLIEEFRFISNRRAGRHIFPSSLRPSAGYKLHRLVNFL